MSALDRLLIGCILAVAALLFGVHEVRSYGAVRFAAGQAAAVAAGKVERDREAEANRKTESDLRAQLAAKDADAYQKEQTYAASLDAAQHRMRAGTDSLRCPESPVPASPAADNRPAAAGLIVEPAGPSLMPEAADDLLGVAADVAGLVRRYDRLEQRFEACRAVNAVP